MMNCKIEKETFTEAYLELIHKLINQGITKAPRGLHASSTSSG